MDTPDKAQESSAFLSEGVSLNSSPGGASSGESFHQSYSHWGLAAMNAKEHFLTAFLAELALLRAEGAEPEVIIIPATPDILGGDPVSSFAMPNAFAPEVEPQEDCLRGPDGENIPPKGDRVNLPDHYSRYAIEPLRFAVENFGRGVLITKIIKYVMRAPFKDNWQEDLDKAVRLMDCLMQFDRGDPDWWKRAQDRVPQPINWGSLDPSLKNG